MLWSSSCESLTFPCALEQQLMSIVIEADQLMSNGTRPCANRTRQIWLQQRAKWSLTLTNVVFCLAVHLHRLNFHLQVQHFLRRLHTLLRSCSPFLSLIFSKSPRHRHFVVFYLYGSCFRRSCFSLIMIVSVSDEQVIDFSFQVRTDRAEVCNMISRTKMNLLDNLFNDATMIGTRSYSSFGMIT